MSEASGLRAGELSAQDGADLVAQLAAACRVRDWTQLADSLARARGWGVPVAVLSAVLGVNAQRVRAICRDHGPGPGTVGDVLGDGGWVGTAAAAAVLGVSANRLLAHRVDADRDGIAVMAGWTRRWHAATLPGWWAQRGVELRTPPAGSATAGAPGSVRLSGLVRPGRRAAAAVGVHPRTVYRYLRDATCG